MKDFLLMAFAVGGAAIAVAGQTVDRSWATRIDPIIEKTMQERLLPGVAIGIVSNGKLVYARGFGEATIGGKQSVPVTPDTLFHMASITKPFVATAIMQLAEQGKLSLDDAVMKYLPYFRLKDQRFASITIRQMLTHTSGMPDVEDYEWNKPQYDDGSLERYVRSLKDRELLWQPGTRFAYSNMAYEVLADVIAKVSGMTFEDYVTNKILIPAGMTSSTLLKEKADPGRLASGYTVDKKGKLAAIPAYPYNRPHNASSDLMSSVNDMARWAMINLNRGELDGKRIMKASTYDEMWTPFVDVEICEPSKPCSKPGSSVGISWFLRSRNGHLIVNHNGGDDGFLTMLGLVPDQKFAFIFVSNSDTASVPLMRQLYGVAMDAVAGPSSIP